MSSIELAPADLYEGWRVVQPLHEAWRNILRRCEDPTSKRYADWGGRGIKVHEPWHDFRVFVEDVLAEIGPRPEGRYPSGMPRYTLDRRNNNGHYEPGNIQWATAFVQVRNRRTTRKLQVIPDEQLGRVLVLGETEPISDGTLPSGAPRLHRAVKVCCMECGTVRLMSM